jgi:trans-aconitate 2-methyltransferase
MKPYLDRLASAVDKRRFQEQVIEECIDLYPVRADGKILFPFRRTFFIAYKD